MDQGINIYSLGDQAFTIALGNAINETLNNKCLALAQEIANAGLPGIKDVITGYSTVSVLYDAALVHRVFQTSSPAKFMRQKLEEISRSCNSDLISPGRQITIPVCFDTRYAFDLESIAEIKGLSIPGFIEQFISTTYRVYMLGFLPGFAYMGKVEDALAAPRKEKPHLNIPAGSIGIAGNQTGIYPLASPGGWNIIGRTPLQLFDVAAEQPCLLKAGDEVQFQPVTPDEFDHLNQHQ